MKDTKLTKTIQHILLIFTLSICLSAFSQHKIGFTYDTAGNQTKQHFIVTKLASQQAAVAQATTAEKPEAPIVQQHLDYYPNPVENQLSLNWSKSTGTHIVSLQIFTVGYKLIKTITPAKTQQQTTLQFNNYAQGIYLVKALFSNGSYQTFKIIKK